MTNTDLFAKMIKGIKVRITKEFREYWGTCDGQWFDIRYVSHDNTACLQDQYYSQFLNVPVNHIKS